MEEEKISEEYKKAYNQADMICRYMPHMVDKIRTSPQGEPSEYTKGFNDRIAQFEKERIATKEFSLDKLKQEYGITKGSGSKNRERERRK